MILQALYDYYQRKEKLGEIASEGFTIKEIDFFIIVNDKGNFIDIECKQDLKGKWFKGHPCKVPVIGKQAEKHTMSGTDANLLWDNSSFVFGVGKNGKIKNESFLQTIGKYYPQPPKDVLAIIEFLKKENKKKLPFDEIINHKEYGEIIQSGTPIVTFKIFGANDPIIEQKHIVNSIKNKKQQNEYYGTCLITGETNVPIEITHTATKGITGAQTSGALLVSFNKPTFNSYKKHQSYNAPVSKHAASSYVKALKYLINSEKNKTRIGDSTVVFWAERKTKGFDLEENFKWFIDDVNIDEPDRNVLAVKGLFESINSGKRIYDEGNRFYVLGLSPSGGRISVRFWKTGKISEFEDKIKQHFDDFEIIKGNLDPEYLSLGRILRAIVLDYKMENVPPNLAGRMVECILDSTPYPQTLLNLCINRIRAEVSKKDQNGKTIQNVTRTRAAILKACLNRAIRFDPNYKMKEVKMSLDLENKNMGYLLGRLFAVLEQIQEKSAGGFGKLNSTIRDRYYGSFSSTPVTVMPALMKLKNHHLAKIDAGLRKWHEDILMEIVEDINAQKIPYYMTLQDQATFAIGYYHQRYVFKGKK